MRLRTLSSLVCGASLVLFAVDCQPRDKQGSQMVGGATVAAPAGGANAWCEAYCKKTSECWSSMPNDNPTKPAAQVLADCRAQTNGCQVSQTTDTMCCSTQADCTNFAACALSSKNAPASCQ